MPESLTTSAQPIVDALRQKLGAEVPVIGATVRAERLARLRGHAPDHLGGHDTFCRVKLAAAFALLDDMAGKKFDPDCVEALSSRRAWVERIQEQFRLSGGKFDGFHEAYLEDL